MHFQRGTPKAPSRFWEKTTKSSYLLLFKIQLNMSVKADFQWPSPCNPKIADNLYHIFGLPSTAYPQWICCTANF